MQVLLSPNKLEDTKYVKPDDDLNKLIRLSFKLKFKTFKFKKTQEEFR